MSVVRHASSIADRHSLYINWCMPGSLTNGTDTLFPRGTRTQNNCANYGGDVACVPSMNYSLASFTIRRDDCDLLSYTTNWRPSGVFMYSVESGHGISALNDGSVCAVCPLSFPKFSKSMNIIFKTIDLSIILRNWLCMTAIIWVMVLAGYGVPFLDRISTTNRWI